MDVRERKEERCESAHRVDACAYEADSGYDPPGCPYTAQPGTGAGTRGGPLVEPEVRLPGARPPVPRLGRRHRPAVRRGSVCWAGGAPRAGEPAVNSWPVGRRACPPPGLGMRDDDWVYSGGTSFHTSRAPRQNHHFSFPGIASPSLKTSGGDNFGRPGPPDNFPRKNSHEHTHTHPDNFSYPPFLKNNEKSLQCIEQAFCTGEARA